jgi:ribulose-phosphate 3-epimerase
MIVSPSFLTADFNKLDSEIKSISSAKWIHFDVMDGIFVPSKTYDETTLSEIKNYSDQFFDCHLMIENPDKLAHKYVEAGASLVTFHYEAKQESVSKTIDIIHDLGANVGISIKPYTDVADLVPYLDQVELILIMSVEPGKGGQKFMEQSLKKIAFLSSMREQGGFRYYIEVDGGINELTLPLVKKAGADVVVVGSYLFKQENRNQVIWDLEHE